MGKYFGTDGFRGEANVNLTVDHAFRIGRYLGWYYSSKAHRAKVVIGKDTRRSSYMFEAALCAGSPPPARTRTCARHLHAERVLHRARRRFRLRLNDLRKPQSVLRSTA